MENLNEVFKRVYKSDRALNVTFIQDWITHGLNAANKLGYLSDESLVYLDGHYEDYEGFICERVLHFSDSNVFILSQENKSYKIDVFFMPALIGFELFNVNQYDGTPEKVIIKYDKFQLELFKNKALEPESLVKILKDIPDFE